MRISWSTVYLLMELGDKNADNVEYELTVIAQVGQQDQYLGIFSKRGILRVGYLSYPHNRPSM